MRVLELTAIFLFCCLASVLEAKASGFEDYQTALKEYQQGQYSQAVLDFQKVIQEIPNSWQAYQGLGSTFLRLGDRPEALQAYQKSLELNPNNKQLKTVMENFSGNPGSPATTASPAEKVFAWDINIGGQFWGWNNNYSFSPNNGTEFYFPVSIAFEPVTNLTLYAQSELGVDSFSGLNPVNPYQTIATTYNAISDTTLGGKVEFNIQNDLQGFANLGFNLPTGSATFMSQQELLPTEFVDVRYQAVTFGISALAGVELPDGTGKYTLEGGYMDPNVYNQTFGLPQGNSPYSLQSDTVFLSASHTQTFSEGSTQTFSFWALFHDTVIMGGFFNIQYGPSFDWDYRLQNPKAFSLDAGAQVFLKNQTSFLILNGYENSFGPLGPEPYDSRGPRLYADPSYTFGQLTVLAQVHYVLPNDYPMGTPFYDEGGWLLGLGPAWKIPMGNNSDLTFSGSYSKIIAEDAAVDYLGNYLDALYNLWRLGIDYDIRF